MKAGMKPLGLALFLIPALAIAQGGQLDMIKSKLREERSALPQAQGILDVSEQHEGIAVEQQDALDSYAFSAHGHY